MVLETFVRDKVVTPFFCLHEPEALVKYKAFSNMI